MLSNIKLEHRDRLYFDRWEYSFAFYQPRVGFIRGLPSDAAFNEHISWRKSSSYYGREIDDRMVTGLEQTLEFLRNETEPFKFVVSYNWGNVYSNDASIGQRLAQASSTLDPRLTRQAVITKPRDTVLLADPKYQFRSYFKAQWFPPEKVEVVREFFAAQQGQIEPCGAFQSFLNSSTKLGLFRHWLPSHYYVEYNDPRYETMLALMMPRGFRKTMPIVKRINN